MATIYQVSELAGVSLATVSRVMNNNAVVSEKTKKKVKDAMQQLGYRPNSIAQSLASSRSNSVGVLISELHGPFYGSMMSGIEAALRTANIHTIIAAGHSNEAKEIDSIEFLISRRCEALILYVESVSDDYLVDLAKGNTPIVVIGRHIPRIAKNCISLDNEIGGYLAAKYLLQQGHKQIAFISGPLWKSDAQDRLNGHKRALAEHKLKFAEELVYEGDFREDGGATGLQQLLDGGEAFTAVACSNDEMAAGAMAYARDQGLRIPEDLSFVGFDDVAYARYVFPKLSTVHYPVGEMGQMAAHWVLKNVYDNKELALKNRFKPDFVVRDSVAKLKL